MANMAIPSNLASVTFQATGAMTATTIHGVVSIDNIDSNETGEYEVSTLESTRKEYLLDLPDSGSVNLGLNFNLDDPGQKALYDEWVDNGGGELIVTITGGQGITPTINTWTAQVLVKKMGSVSLGRAKAVTGEAILRVNSSAWDEAA